MSVEISLENLRQDLENTRKTGEFAVHDFLESSDPTESWVRANNLAQIAINPARFINQQPPKGAVTAGNKILIPSKVLDTPPGMVHFGSEVTANAALGMIGIDSDDYSNDIHFHQRLDTHRLGASALTELLGAHDTNEMPAVLVSLENTYDGPWRYEDAQQLYFMYKLAQFFPDYREILLPNSVTILSEHSQDHLRDYFKIGRAAWQTITSADEDSIDYHYKV